MKSIKKAVWTIFLIFGLVTLGSAFAAADAVIIPSKSAVNPIHQTLYVPDNTTSPARIRVYSYNGSSWNTTPTNITPAGILTTAKIYGLTVSEDGSSLFVSINDLRQSRVRIYALTSGTPGTYQDATWARDGSGNLTEGDASIAGMAVQGDMLYVADMNLGRIHYFKKTNGTWAHNGDITGGLSVLGPYFDVAVSAPEANGNYSIFVTRKSNTSAKELLVYRYESGAVVNTLKTSFDLQVPTYLKIAGGKLCIALNGTDGDVKIYTISSTSPYLTEKATISNPSGVTANYGWN